MLDHANLVATAAMIAVDWFEMTARPIVVWLAWLAVLFHGERDHGQASVSPLVGGRLHSVISAPRF